VDAEGATDSIAPPAYPMQRLARFRPGDSRIPFACWPAGPGFAPPQPASSKSLSCIRDVCSAQVYRRPYPRRANRVESPLALLLTRHSHYGLVESGNVGSKVPNPKQG
jgi:hypothetical protein